MSTEAGFAPLGPQHGALADYRGAVIIPHDPAGRALLQFRDFAAPVHPGEWGLFGGGVEALESLAEAAAREFEEETGLRRPEGEFRPFARIVSPVSRRPLYAFTLALHEGAEAIRLCEGAGFGLFAPPQFAALPMVGATRILLAAWAGRSSAP